MELDPPLQLIHTFTGLKLDPPLPDYCKEVVQQQVILHGYDNRSFDDFPF